MEKECEVILEAYKKQETARVQRLLSSDRAADLRSVQLWRIRKLAGFEGFGCVAADRAEPGIWWTAAGLRVQKHPLPAPQARKLRKYLVRVRNFRGTAAFGTSRVAGHGGGAPIITTTSIDEDDTIEEPAAEEGVPPQQPISGAEKSTLNQVEALSGVDIDGDGDIGLTDAEEIHRPIRTRVWDGHQWLVNWEYEHGALGEYKGSDWTSVRLESATSESICVEVHDPDMLASAGGGRIGVAVMAASVGYGWQPVFNISHSVVGHVFVEIKKQKKKPKQDVPIKPVVTRRQEKYQFVPDSKDGLGLRLSERAVIIGYSNQDGAAQKAGVPVGSIITQINEVSVMSRRDVTDVLQRESSKTGGWHLEWVCELPEPAAAFESEDLSDIDPSSAPAAFTVEVGSLYNFEEELRAFEALQQLFTEHIDAVVLEVNAMQEVAMALMTRGFHSVVQRAIVERWGTNGCHELEPHQFGHLMSFLKSYLEFMASFGWAPTPEFMDVISTELLGDTAQKACLTIAEKIEEWMENCLVHSSQFSDKLCLSVFYSCLNLNFVSANAQESEDDILEGEALRTTLPDDLLAALAYLMKVTAGSQSVMWMLRVFRCISDTVSNCIPSLFADHALPHVDLHLMRTRTRGPKLIGKPRYPSV